MTENNAPAPSPSPSPSPLPAWYGDSHKDYVTNKGFKTADDALVSLQNAEKLIGAEKAGRTLVRPKDDKDAEGIKAWRTGIGVPEKAEDYGLPVPQGEADDFAKTASGWFHEIGISKSDAVKLTEKWNAHIAEIVKTSDAALKADSDKQLGALKGEWGGDFDKKSEEARRFMKASGWDDAKIARYEQAFGTADMLKTFQSLGAKLGEAGFTKGDGTGKVTKAQAREQLDAARAARADGKMSEADYLKKVDELGPIAEAA